jgi:hypothetical protein
MKIWIKFNNCIYLRPDLIYHRNLLTSKRQEFISQKFRFKCSCSPCVNNWKMDSLLLFPACDRNFVMPRVIPANFKDIIKDFKKNCAYIKKNSKSIPTYEIFVMMLQNYDHISILNELCAWPICQESQASVKVEVETEFHVETTYKPFHKRKH